MITAQDIREKSFEKAVFGGYDMAMVDEFMEEIAADLTLLQKENGVLKSKMKILVDKVDEYRGNEDALRNAVFSAQKLGTSIEQDAKAKASTVLEDARSQAETILRDARSQAETIVGDARAEAERVTAGVADRLKAEESRLEDAQKVSAEFIDRMDQLCHRELEFLQRVSEMDFMIQHRAAQQASSAPAQSAQSAPVAAPVVPAAPPVAAAAPVIPAPPAAAPVTVAPAPSAAQPFPIPAVVPDESKRAEIHETVRSIEETVAKVMDEPVINVRPGIAPPLVEDERPTRSFNIITDPEDSVDKSTQFTMDDFTK